MIANKAIRTETSIRRARPRNGILCHLSLITKSKYYASKFNVDPNQMETNQNFGIESGEIDTLESVTCR